MRKVTGDRQKRVQREVKRGIPKDEGTKDERQDENKEETVEDRTGIGRARRLEMEADTESNQEVQGE